MWITLPEAVTIYARFYQSRYGTAASQLARDQARHLKAKGDSQGHEAWNSVAQEIEQLRVMRPTSNGALT